MGTRGTAPQPLPVRRAGEHVGRTGPRTSCQLVATQPTSSFQVRNVRVLVPAKQSSPPVYMRSRYRAGRQAEKTAAGDGKRT